MSGRSFTVKNSSTPSTLSQENISVSESHFLLTLDGGTFLAV